MPRAILVTEESIPAVIIPEGEALGINLDYVKDNYDYADEFANESCYLVVDGTKEDNNATSTMFIEEDFLRNWQFKTLEDPTKFVEIVRA